MLNWITRWFRRDTAAATTAVRPAPAVVVGRITPAAPPGDRAVRDGSMLNDAQVAFLATLAAPPDPASMDDLSPDDRAFVAGIQRRLRTRELDLPVLPEMALRLAEMIRQGVPVSDFVTLINGDASLAVEVLRTANSAFYAGGRRLTSLQDAIVRIGLERLQSVLMVAHLRGKVLKAGPLQAEADLLLDLALPLGHLASNVAAGHDQQADTCFMRGALHHVEHLVMVGATPSIARDVKRTLMPTPRGLHHASVRFGGTVREAVAAKWHLADLLLGAENETDVGGEYDLIRRTLICHWLRQPLPEEAARFEGLDAALKDVPHRVAA